MRYIYTSKKGGKPLTIGMNQAKRVARAADARDQKLVVATLGGGLPREHSHHQQLVRSRYHYYSEVEATGETPNGTNRANHFKHASGIGPRETARRMRFESVNSGKRTKA